MPTIVTNYQGEVLDEILTMATTSNELFENGLIRVIPNVRGKIAIPRLSVSNLLQKRKSDPNKDNSKGSFGLDDLVLAPQDVMVYMEFNPRELESYWRPYQPTGNLVYSELPDNIKVKLIEEVVKQASKEIGDKMLNSVLGAAEGEYFDGFIKRITSATDKVEAVTLETSMMARLQAVWDATPKEVRKSSNFVFLCSNADAGEYCAELAALPTKGTDPTAADKPYFKGKRVIGLNAMPDELIIATVASLDQTSNLVVACAMESDAEAVDIQKVSNASENYFLKMLMKYDTGVVYTSQVTVFDNR